MTNPLVSQKRDPALIMFSALIVVLLPAALWFLWAHDRAERHRLGRALPGIPTADSLLAVAKRFDPAMAQCRIVPLELPSEPPVSGVVAAYRVLDGQRVTYHLAVLRHDIDCETCRDLVAVVFLGPKDGDIRTIVPLTPWETANGPIDPVRFLTQFQGYSALDSLQLQNGIDGITGASLTVQGMLTELGALGHWATTAFLDSGN